MAALRGDGGIAIDLDGPHRLRPGAACAAASKALPDAPACKFVLTLRGGKHGLLVNSANLCAAPQLATARLVGQNNRGERWQALRAECK